MTVTRRALLQGVSAFAASSAFAATTGKIALTNAAWTDLGPGPLLLKFSGDAVYAIGDATPTIPLGEGFTIRPGKSVKVMTPSHVWAMARGSAGASAYVAPIAGGTGGGGGSTSVWSAADAAAGGMTLTNGGLTVTPGAVGHWQAIRSTTSKSSGKVYVEFSNSVAASTWTFSVGLASAGITLGGSSFALGASNYSVGIITTTTVNVSSGFTKNYTPNGPDWQPAAGVVFALAIDFTAGSIWFADNNVWTNSSNPATGSLPCVSFVPATVGALFAAMDFGATGVGVWTLQSTAASQKYAPPSGFSAWDSAAPTHSPQALAYLARTVGGNEGGNAANIATLIDGLVSDGVWAKLDALYVLAQQNQSDARLNLLSASYPLTGGAATFTAYQGFSAFGQGGQLSTGFNPASSPGAKFTQNSGSLGAWAYAPIFYGQMIGTAPSSGGSSILFYNNAANNQSVNNSAILGTGTTCEPGLWTADRNVASTVEAYLNGSHLGSLAAVSAALDGHPMAIGDTFDGQGWDTRPGGISAVFIGASLGAAGQTALYNRLLTYMTAVGWTAASAKPSPPSLPAPKDRR